AALAGSGRARRPPRENRSVVVSLSFAGPLAAGLERMPTAAAGSGVGVLDGEAAPHQVFLVVDLGPFQVTHAHRVHDDLDAARLEDLVAFGDLVEDHPVLEPGAATSLDVDPEATLGQVGLLLLQHRLDLLGRGGGEIDHLRAPPSSILSDSAEPAKPIPGGRGP